MTVRHSEEADQLGRLKNQWPGSAIDADGSESGTSGAGADGLSDFDEMGPVDFLVLEFPDFKPTGEALSQLVELTERGIVRILDLLFVRKDADGTVQGMAVTDLDGDGTLDLSIFDGASSGLLGDDDLREAGGVMQPGSAGVVLVYENLWAAPLARTLRKKGAQMVAGGRIPVQALLSSIDALEV